MQNSLCMSGLKSTCKLYADVQQFVRLERAARNSLVERFSLQP
jgi:hypothetical protein